MLCESVEYLEDVEPVNYQTLSILAMVSLLTETNQHPCCLADSLVTWKSAIENSLPNDMVIARISISSDASASSLGKNEY